jgi:hypothetical protein
LPKHGAAARSGTFHLAKELSMTSLRQRFIEDMQVRNFSLVTQASYTREVSEFARYHPDKPMFRFFPNAKRSLDSLLDLITDLVVEALLFFRLLFRSRTL